MAVYCNNDEGGQLFGVVVSNCFFTTSIWGVYCSPRAPNFGPIGECIGIHQNTIAPYDYMRGDNLYLMQATLGGPNSLGGFNPIWGNNDCEAVVNACWAGGGGR